MSKFIVVVTQGADKEASLGPSAAYGVFSSRQDAFHWAVQNDGDVVKDEHGSWDVVPFQLVPGPLPYEHDPKFFEGGNDSTIA